MRKVLLGVLVLLLASIFTMPAYSETTFKWGPYWRIRHEFWKNYKDTNNETLDNRNYFRIKSSLWGQADFDQNNSLYVKLTNEFRTHAYFGGTTVSFPDKKSPKKSYHFDINEVVFDNLYCDFKNFVDLPLDIRLGRQDFLGTYGEGFILMDGTPQDGSRTFYFNAAKASYRVNDENTLDVIYINDPRDEEILPVINGVNLVQQSNPNLDKAPQSLNTTDEQGLVLYLKNKSIEHLGLEGYYVYKYEAEEGGVGRQSQKGEINTIGSFAKYDFSPWILRGQLAGQFGEYGDNSRTGIGGYAYLDREFKDAMWTPKASIGYVYLSGDNRSTDNNEAWDPVFSRWPWLSELYVMTVASDAGNSISGYWTNVQAYRAEFSVKPTQKTKLTLWYNYLRANAQVATSTVCSGEDKSRGHLPQARADYAFNKNVSAYLLAEYFIPGDFYKGDDPGLFLRTELQIKF